MILTAIVLVHVSRDGGLWQEKKRKEQFMTAGGGCPTLDGNGD
jgi:hypothetical protein